MKRAVMISINPPHTDNIFSGEKTIEWRKKPLPLGKHYVYETKRGGGAGKVIGEFEVVAFVWYAPDDYIHEDEIKAGCVSREYVEKYRGNGKIAANWIRNVKRYGKPKELCEFRRWEDFGKDIRPCQNGVDCKYSIYDYGEDRECCAIDFDGESCPYYFLQRAPQSWCYVEELI